MIHLGSQGLCEGMKFVIVLFRMSIISLANNKSGVDIKL